MATVMTNVNLSPSLYTYNSALIVLSHNDHGVYALIIECSHHFLRDRVQIIRTESNPVEIGPKLKKN